MDIIYDICERDHYELCLFSSTKKIMFSDVN